MESYSIHPFVLGFLAKQNVFLRLNCIVLSVHLNFFLPHNITLFEYRTIYSAIFFEAVSLPHTGPSPSTQILSHHSRQHSSIKLSCLIWALTPTLWFRSETLKNRKGKLKEKRNYLKILFASFFTLKCMICLCVYILSQNIARLIYISNS